VVLCQEIVPEFKNEVLEDGTDINKITGMLIPELNPVRLALNETAKNFKRILWILI
jgi:hypothetical protein